MKLAKLQPKVKMLNTSIAAIPSKAPTYGLGRGGRPWRRRREGILKRDDYLCVPCRAQGHLTLATEVDHKTPQAEGGTDEDDNLQSICSDCHKTKTQAESARGIQRSRYGE